MTCALYQSVIICTLKDSDLIAGAFWAGFVKSLVLRSNRSLCESSWLFQLPEDRLGDMPHNECIP